MNQEILRKRIYEILQDVKSGKLSVSKAQRLILRLYRRADKFTQQMDES